MNKPIDMVGVMLLMLFVSLIQFFIFPVLLVLAFTGKLGWL